MNEKQRAALKRVCERFNAPFDEEHYLPDPSCGDGWVAGWVGGKYKENIFVGCSPEGHVHS